MPANLNPPIHARPYQSPPANQNLPYKTPPVQAHPLHALLLSPRLAQPPDPLQDIFNLHYPAQIASVPAALPCLIVSGVVFLMAAKVDQEAAQCVINFLEVCHCAVHHSGKILGLRTSVPV